MRHDNENNLGADVFIDWVDNSSGYDGLVGSSSLGNRLAGTIFGGTGSAFENFTSAPQNAPPGATHAAVRVTTRNTTTTDEFGTVTLAAGGDCRQLRARCPIRITHQADQLCHQSNHVAGGAQVGVECRPDRGERHWHPEFCLLLRRNDLDHHSDLPRDRGCRRRLRVQLQRSFGQSDGPRGGGTVFVDWFDNSSLLVGSTIDFGGDFQTTSRVAGDPYGNFTHSVTAPLNATFAGVRWGTAGVTGGQVIADNFSIVVPEPSGFALFVGSLGGLCLLRRRA